METTSWSFSQKISGQGQGWSLSLFFSSVQGFALDQTEPHIPSGFFIFFPSARVFEVTI